MWIGTLISKLKFNMETLIAIIQIIIGAGILNVWFLRFKKSSIYRGGSATNMVEEFRVYGLPEQAVYVVGFLKVLFALFLIVGVWVPALTLPGAVGLGLLMLGAIAMHLKVGDAPVKSLPAFTLLVLCIVVVAHGIYCGCLAG